LWLIFFPGKKSHNRRAISATNRSLLKAAVAQKESSVANLREAMIVGGDNHQRPVISGVGNNRTGYLVASYCVEIASGLVS